MMPDDLHEIVARIRAGDQAAFSKLVEMYRDHAFRIAFRILADEEEAKETVQETFIRVWRKIGSYDPARPFASWMNKILVNITIDHLRTLKRLSTVPLDEASLALENLHSADPSLKSENRNLALLIRYLAGTLPAKQKLVFVLRDIEDMPSNEVEILTGMTEDSVKSNLFHARKRVREQLTNIIEKERSVKCN